MHWIREGFIKSREFSLLCISGWIRTHMKRQSREFSKFLQTPPPTHPQTLRENFLLFCIFFFMKPSWIRFMTLLARINLCRLFYLQLWLRFNSLVSRVLVKESRIVTNEIFQFFGTITSSCYSINSFILVKLGLTRSNMLNQISC